jgi:multiple sugar transport system substrate-binding protein
MFRQSQLEEPSAWTGKELDASTVKQYGETLRAALARRETLLMPRIPGETGYLAALDDAVAAALGGKKSPQKALDEAAAQWQQITDRLGRDSQLEAYRRSLKGVR